MNATPTHDLFERPEITRHDRARFVKEARRLRAQEFDKLFRAIGPALARLGRALTAPVTTGRSGRALLRKSDHWRLHPPAVRRKEPCHAEPRPCPDPVPYRSQIDSEEGFLGKLILRGRRKVL